MLDPTAADRLIVYGGTFDPPHRAHVTLPFLVAERLGADGVLFIPAGQPPHKPDRPVAAAAHRLAMLHHALGDRDDAAVCDYEIRQGGKSYTWQTLEHLRRTLEEGVELRLLIGADMAVIFDQWARPERIEQLAEPVVMLRPPHETRAALLDQLAPERRSTWAKRLVEVPAMDISSTEVRRRLADPTADERALREWLPPAVLHYIREHGLYQGG